MVSSRADGHFGSVFRLGPLCTRPPPRNPKEKTKKKVHFAPRFLSPKRNPCRLIRIQQSSAHVVTQTLPRKSKQSGETSGGSGRIRATLLSLVTVVCPETNLPSKFRQNCKRESVSWFKNLNRFQFCRILGGRSAAAGCFQEPGARSQEPGARRPTQLPQED